MVTSGSASLTRSAWLSPRSSRRDLLERHDVEAVLLQVGDPLVGDHQPGLRAVAHDGELGRAVFLVQVLRDGRELVFAAQRDAEVVALRRIGGELLGEVGRRAVRDLQLAGLGLGGRPVADEPIETM